MSALLLWAAMVTAAAPIYLFLVWALVPTTQTTEENLP